jgi:hypothetical protein
MAQLAGDEAAAVRVGGSSAAGGEVAEGIKKYFNEKAVHELANLLVEAWQETRGPSQLYPSHWVKQILAALFSREHFTLDWKLRGHGNRDEVNGLKSDIDLEWMVNEKPEFLWSIQSSHYSFHSMGDQVEDFERMGLHLEMAKQFFSLPVYSSITAMTG